MTDASHMRAWRHDEAAGLAACIAAHPGARVAAYPEWDLRDLAVHVVRVLTNARLALSQPSLDRPTPDLNVDRNDEPDALSSAIIDALDAAERARDGCQANVVWTPVGPRTPEFWDRRLLRECVLHHWDAQDAIGARQPPHAARALVLIDEFLDTDVARALAGDRHIAHGSVAIAAGRDGWIIDLDDRSVTRDGIGSASAMIEGEPADVWLWLMRRSTRASELTIRDDNGAASAFEQMISDFNRPSS